MKNIFITGASGFIGSSLVRYLASKSIYNVVGSSRSLLSKLQTELSAPIVHLNLPSESLDLSSANTVIHCATPNDVAARDVKSSREFILSGTESLLKEAIRSNVKDFIY